MAEGRACRAAHSAIVDLVDARAIDHPEAGSLESAPRRHLEARVERAARHAAACPDCRRTIEAVVLVDHRLRRYARAVRRAPVPGDRVGLRRRLGRRQPEVWRWRAGLAGLTLAAAIVGLLSGPGAVWRPRFVALQEAGVEPGLMAALRRREERQEAIVLTSQLRVRSQPPPRLLSDRPTHRAGQRPNPASEADGTPIWAGPDGLGVGRPDGFSADGPTAARTS